MAQRLLTHPLMFNLPPFGPLDTAGAPIASTIVVVGTPFVMAAAMMLGIVVVLLAAVLLRARRARRPVTASPRRPVATVAVRYAEGGGR